jgi:hypothetical protein
VSLTNEIIRSGHDVHPGYDVQQNANGRTNTMMIHNSNERIFLTDFAHRLGMGMLCEARDSKLGILRERF